MTPAILYMTSGATGEPKMGLVTQWAVGANLDMGPQVLPLGPEDSYNRIPSRPRTSRNEW